MSGSKGHSLYTLNIDCMCVCLNATYLLPYFWQKCLHVSTTTMHSPTSTSTCTHSLSLSLSHTHTHTHTHITASKFVALLVPSCPGAPFDLATNHYLAAILNSFTKEKSKPDETSGKLVHVLFLLRANVCSGIWGIWSLLYIKQTIT